MTLTEESSFLDVIMSDDMTTHHDIMSSRLNVTGPGRRSGSDIDRDNMRLCQEILVTLHCIVQSNRACLEI